MTKSKAAGALYTYFTEHGIGTSLIDSQSIEIDGCVVCIATAQHWQSIGILKVDELRWMKSVEHLTRDVLHYYRSKSSTYFSDRKINTKSRYKLHHQLKEHKIDCFFTDSQSLDYDCILKDESGEYDNTVVRRIECIRKYLRGDFDVRSVLFRKGAEHVQRYHKIKGERLQFFNLKTQSQLQQHERLFENGLHARCTDNYDCVVVSVVDNPDISIEISRSKMKTLLHMCGAYTVEEMIWVARQEVFAQPSDTLFHRLVKERAPYIAKAAYGMILPFFPDAVIRVEADNNLTVKVGDNELKGTLDFIRSRIAGYATQPDLFFCKSGCIFTSKAQIEICSFIQSLGFDCEMNVRSLIKPNEIDIYIPSHKIGFEFNGIAYHSENGIGSQISKERTYHIKKKEAAANAKIDLYHICESDWRIKQDIVKSIICAKFGLYAHKFYARKCICKTIDTATASNFHHVNHLAGRASAQYHIGVYAKEELVAVMSIADNRKVIRAKDMPPGSFEMVRYTLKQNTAVVGGLSRALKYAIKAFSIKHIHTFVDRNMFNGNGYIQAGFKYVRVTAPGYAYIHSQTFKKVHRSTFMKHRLIQKYPEYAHLSEMDIVSKLKYFRVWNCGNIILEYCI